MQYKLYFTRHIDAYLKQTYNIDVLSGADTGWARGALAPPPS